MISGGIDSRGNLPQPIPSLHELAHHLRLLRIVREIFLNLRALALRQLPINISSQLRLDVVTLTAHTLFTFFTLHFDFRLLSHILTQHLPQRQSRPKEPAFHCAQRQLKHLRDLCIFHPFHIPHHQNRAVFRVNPVQRFGHFARPFFLDQRVFRAIRDAIDQIGGLPVAVVVARLIDRIRPPPFPFKNGADREVRRDAKQQGVRLSFAAEARQDLASSPQTGFLRQFARLFPISDDFEDRVVDAILKRLDDEPKRRAIAGLSLAFIHSVARPAAFSRSRATSAGNATS